MGGVRQQGSTDPLTASINATLGVGVITDTNLKNDLLIGVGTLSPIKSVFTGPSTVSNVFHERKCQLLKLGDMRCNLHKTEHQFDVAVGPKIGHFKMVLH